MSSDDLEHSRGAESASMGDGFLLHSEAGLAEAARRAIQTAIRAGAGAAMAAASESGGLNMQITNRELETATRDGSQSLQILVYENGRTGSASTQALNFEAIDRTVSQAIAIARQLEPDPDAGLADANSLAWDTPAVPLFAPSGLTAAELLQAALEIEAGALSGPVRDPVRVVEAGAASQDMRWAVATSQDFCRTGSGSLQQRWCVTIAERGNVMARDYWADRDRRTEHLLAAREIGRRAAERSSAKLGAEDLATQRSSVLFDSTIASSLVSELCQTLTGAAQLRRATFLPDAVGREAAARHVNIMEDPFEPYGLASATHDADGVAGVRRPIVEEGRVVGLFLDTLMARKLGMRSTGNAGGIRNITLSSRLTNSHDDVATMLRKMGRGLWLTEFLGGGVDPVTGVFSKAARGFWIENGAVICPVENFTVAGNVLEVLRGTVAVGADVYRDGPVRTGSILVDHLQIAGR